jgi:chemotaxis protein methyltransferase CheR
MMPRVALAEQELERFRHSLTRILGFQLTDDKLPLLSETLITRLRATGAPDVGVYLEREMRSHAEQQALARELSIGETYFLRNRDQFRALAALIQQRRASGRRNLRLLSAACSSGEEPYSLAIVVRDTLPDFLQWNISITAFDLNPDVLERARAGRYTAWSLRETPDDVRARYFQSDGSTFAIHPHVQEMVQFHTRNLVDPDAGFWRSNAFDIVFCRNVLMYFTPDAMRSVVQCIARSLVPDGHLFLGHAETLRGISRDFSLQHSHATFYYRVASHAGDACASHGIAPPEAAPTARVSAGEAGDEPWFDAISHATGRIQQLSRATVTHSSAPTPVKRATADLHSAMDLLQKERFTDALAVLAGTSSSDAGSDALLLRAVLLLGSGDPAGAEEVCRDLLRHDELCSGAHYVMALCRECAGDCDGAREHGSIAAYLDAGFAMPHLHMGLLARRCGDLATAQRELALAQGLLAREDGARIVLFGGGFGREALIDLCRSQLAACEMAGETMRWRS